METLDYKFVLMTATHFKVILSNFESLILCFSHNSENFILYYLTHEVNLCLSPHFGGNVTSLNRVFFFSKQERETWERG